MGLQSLPAGPLNILQAQLRRAVAPGRPLSAPLATPLLELSLIQSLAYFLALFLASLPYAMPSGEISSNKVTTYQHRCHCFRSGPVAPAHSI